MSPESWNIVNKIFTEAVTVEEERRNQFIRLRCGENSEIREEVEALLRFRREEDSLLINEPSRGLAARMEIDFNSWTGRRLGKFELKRVISYGGMGVVFLAQQRRPNRDVAVKILYRGLLGGGVSRRFAIEAEILGRLDHPFIAKIHEADRTALTPPPEEGPTAPLHYYAMEYVVDARTLTEFVRAEELNRKDRLQLFVKICEGVQHGHQKGVIHRDLKPSNILVRYEEYQDGRRIPIPKIIDFGVAKCSDDDIAVTTMQTAAGDLIGTLQYMSPEQCGADSMAVDTRADVYALGIILYQLLTDQVPYDVSNCTLHGAIKIIFEAAPTPMNRFDRRLRGDLEAVAVKALEKNREKRYGSVNELAEEVRRFLRGDPIEARPPTRWERSMRWVTKHPRLTATIASILISVSIIGSTAFSIWIANSKPYRFTISQNGEDVDPRTGMPRKQGNRATLYSFSNRAIYSWTSQENGIKLGAMIKRPKEWGGGEVIVFSSFPHNDPELSGKLCLYDANNPETLIWSRSIAPDAVDEMPDEAWPRPKKDPNRKYFAEGFNVGYACVVDIYKGAKHPGEEIVAYSQFENGTQGALEIYNLNGDVLFRAWQDGGVKDVYWMKNANRLICVAIKGDMYPTEYGWKTDGTHPQVVFAIDPEAGNLSNAWIHPHPPGKYKRFSDDNWKADWFKANWYRSICPAEWGLLSQSRIYMRPPTETPYPHSSFCQLMVELVRIDLPNGTPYNFSGIIDQTGEIVYSPAENNEVLEAQENNPNMPKAVDLKLLQWKKRNPPCEPRNVNFP